MHEVFLFECAMYSVTKIFLAYVSVHNIRTSVAGLRLPPGCARFPRLARVEFSVVGHSGLQLTPEGVDGLQSAGVAEQDGSHCSDPNKWLCGFAAFFTDTYVSSFKFHAS